MMTHTGYNQCLEAMLKDARGLLVRSEMKLQEKSRSHKEEIRRVEGTPSISVPCSMCNVYVGSMYFTLKSFHLITCVYIHTYVCSYIFENILVRNLESLEAKGSSLPWP